MKLNSTKKYRLQIYFAAAIIIFFAGLNNFAFAVGTGNVDFSWLPNAEVDLAGYKIHYDTNQDGIYDSVVDVGNPPPVEGRIKGNVSGLTEGVTYSFVATAYNEAGLESDYSDVAVYTCPITQTDTTPPVGTITIDEGAAVTTNTLVLLALSASDTESDIAQMKFSNNNVDWSAAETYATSKSWMLSDGSGIKTVYVKFKDEPGNWSSSYNDTIELIAEVVLPDIPSGLRVTSID